MFFKIHIRRHERGLWFRKGDFVRLLQPGTHYNWDFLWNLTSGDRVQVADTLKTRFAHEQLELLARQPGLREELLTLDLADGQRALVWKDARLLTILGPGLHAFWKSPAKLEVEIYSVEQFRFEHPKLQAILAHPDALKWLDGVQVNVQEDVLLFRDGVMIERLGAGLHVFWKGTGKIAWKAIDRREQVADVAGQEIMTSDKVTLRVNLIVTFIVSDVVRAITATSDYVQALYREAQLVLRAAVGTKALDALLSDKESVGAEVREALGPRAEDIGLTVRSVGLRDIILPGDMKSILNQVIQAQKEAEANLIKRREETAAARSQANTAKLLADNPVLQRLRELELLKDVLAGANTTFVFAPGDIADQVRGLVAKP